MRCRTAGMANRTAASTTIAPATASQVRFNSKPRLGMAIWTLREPVLEGAVALSRSCRISLADW